jgi:hypothetical protein
MRGVRRALVEHLRGAVGERAVDDVAVAGDPPDVGGAPVDVGLGLEVEDVLVREGGLREVPAAGVQDALRLPGGAARVEDEQWVLGLEALRLVLVGDALELLVPPQVAARGPLDLVLAAASAASTAPLSGKTLPLRQPPSAVMTSEASASSTRARMLSALNPPKMTEWIAPRRATASMAMTASGITGM